MKTIFRRNLFLLVLTNVLIAQFVQAQVIHNLNQCEWNINHNIEVAGIPDGSCLHCDKQGAGSGSYLHYANPVSIGQEHDKKIVLHTKINKRL